MTTVILNSVGIDIVELKLETTGTNFCHFSTDDNILNSDLSYIFAVTDLNVDCSLLPIFAPGTNDTLITIKKRHIGDAVAILPNADVEPTFGISDDGARYHDSTTFIAALSTYANSFSTKLDAVGITAAAHGGGPDIAAGVQAIEEVPYLKIGIDASGRLQITGIAQFWNHFVIVLSDFAKKMFHFEHETVENALSVTFVGGVYTTTGILDGGPVPVGNNLTKSTITAHVILLYFVHETQSKIPTTIIKKLHVFLHLDKFPILENIVNAE